MIKNIRLIELKPGMSVGRDIFSSSGNLLTERGTIVTPEMLIQFEKWDMTFVPVLLEDERSPVPLKDERPPVLFENERPPDLLKDERPPVPGRLAPEPSARMTMSLQEGDELKRETLTLTGQIVDNLRVRKTIDRDRTKHLVGKLVEEASGNRDILATLLQVRRFDNYLFNHSLNVSVLAILVGQMLKVSEKQLYLLGEAALLHDLGMSIIPKTIWNKAGALTDNERFEIQKHPVLSADLIEKISVAEPDLIKAVYQHHEREDGSGYPKGLESVQIHELAKILAVVDVYDAMTNPRSYRENLAPSQAVKTILTLTNRSLNQDVVRAFIAEMSLYPVGSVVRLNTGALGIAIRSSRHTPLRPLLKLVRDEWGRPFDGQVFVDLGSDRSAFIVENLLDPEVLRSLEGTLSGVGAA